MAKWRINGTTVVDIYVEVEADTLEEAIDKADSEYHLEEYCNNTIGCESYEYGEAEMCATGWIEWNEEFAEQI